jgi:hypothetical protein
VRSIVRIGLFLGVSVLALAVVSVADAALAFRFDRVVARPGARVTAFEPGWHGAPRGIVVYLVPTRLPGVSPPPGYDYVLSHVPTRHVIELGRPTLNRSHRLFVRFRVPNVVPGYYTTAFWCGTCARRGDFFASAVWGATPAEAAPGTVLRVTR